MSTCSSLETPQLLKGIYSEKSWLCSWLGMYHAVQLALFQSHSEARNMGVSLPISQPFFLLTVFNSLLLDLVDRMGVWILDGVVWHSQLLPFVLTKNTITHTTVMIVVDLSQPWNIMESLERWAEVVRRHINTLQIPDRELRDMEETSESLAPPPTSLPSASHLPLPLPPSPQRATCPSPLPPSPQRATCSHLFPDCMNLWIIEYIT